MNATTHVHKRTQALIFTNTTIRTHDLSVYCSHFYGGPISLLLPFVLRIISLHKTGGAFSCLSFPYARTELQFFYTLFFLSHFFPPSFTFSFSAPLLISVSVLPSHLAGRATPNLSYLHCASGWHFVLKLGFIQVCASVRVCACVCVCILVSF